LGLVLAAGREIFLRLFGLAAVVCLLLMAQALWAQQPQESPANQYVIGRIEFIGNRRIQTGTLRGRILSREGDPYNIDALRRDFELLWNTQFFDDIRLEVEDSPTQPNAKIVIFFVKERPIIRRIEYCEGSSGCGGLKTITESDILDAFKDKKVGISVESQFDPTKVTRAAVVIKELLAAHGRQFATVKPTYEKIAATDAVKLIFRIDEGPKVKVGKIIIKGNKAFSDRRLIRTMRNDRPYAIPLYFTYIPVMDKTYDRPKLDEDLELGIRSLYQNNGYFRVDVNVAGTKTVDINRGGIPGPWPVVGSKHEKATNITITVSEGEQYHMGKLTFRSSDPDQGLVFKPPFLAAIFPMKAGDIFSIDKLRKSFKNYKDLYGEYGYIDFNPNPDFDIDDAKKVINLTLDFDQEKQYYVRRINFSGNTTTRDKVIRREILLDEGQVFNNHLWELSILRLNQLNYFDKIDATKDADLKRNPKTGSVDILLKLREKQKQSISFSGGVSGLAGSFIGLSYQTNNFLGLGETLTLSAQIGDIQKSILFGFTEPYLFDRPISTGFTIFSNQFNYNTARQTGLLLGTQVAINPALQENYTNNSKGFTAFASYPIRKFSFARFGLTYGWSTTNITAFSQSAQLLFEFTQFRSLAGPSALSGIRESYVMPSLTYNRIDSPVNPTHGLSYSLSERFEGGPLQGNVNSAEEIFSLSYFHPNYHRRNVFGFRVQAATISGYAGKNAPPYNKFYMGGEYDIRGFQAYTISPFVAIPNLSSTPITYIDPTRLGSNGQPTTQTINVPTLQYVPTRPGGDSQMFANMEYRIPLYQQYLGLTLFNDIGANGILWKDQLQLDPTAVTTLQQEYPNSDFPGLRIGRNLPIISGTNFAPHGSVGVEMVVQLPIIQAPFRFYWAYNYARLTGTIQGPLVTDANGNTLPGAYYLSDAQKSALPYGVLQTQIVPQLEQFLQIQSQKLPASLIEQKSVFRFTVSRTF
jgi:outer membrane protein insertion porin family